MKCDQIEYILKWELPTDLIPAKFDSYCRGGYLQD
jgi:hypothetical protein